MAVTLPTGPTTANVDSGTLDTPKNARADIKTLIEAVNTLLGQINALGIMQIGDGLENDAQAAATKDKLRVKLDGAGITSGLARSASGLKIAPASITLAMLAQNGAASGQVPQWNGSAWTVQTISSGEVNTNSNVGAGLQLVKTKVAFDTPVRTILMARAVYLDGLLHNTTGADPGGAFDRAFTLAVQNANDITFTSYEYFVSPPPDPGS